MFFFYEEYTPSPQRIDDFAGGWDAGQVLAIGLWCALTARSFEEGVIAAVNHNGNSSSAGLVVGHLLRAQYGGAFIPDRWLEPLQLRQVIAQMAEDIERVPRDYCGVGGEFDEQIELAYPAS